MIVWASRVWKVLDQVSAIARQTPGVASACLAVLFVPSFFVVVRRFVD